MARWRALPAGALAGAISGALVGGVAGRVLMRLVFLIDRSTDGAKTEFGTIGEVTLGGTLTLLMLCTITGTLGGVMYMLVRRWLPWSGIARGAGFTALTFMPGLIFLGEIDLRLAEPAVPIFAMFVGLFAVYSVLVAVLSDRLHAAPPVQQGARSQRATVAGQVLVGLVFAILAVLVTVDVQSNGGSCLSADQKGGCAIEASD